MWKHITASITARDIAHPKDGVDWHRLIADAALFLGLLLTSSWMVMR